MCCSCMKRVCQVSALPAASLHPEGARGIAGAGLGGFLGSARVQRGCGYTPGWCSFLGCISPALCLSFPDDPGETMHLPCLHPVFGTRCNCCAEIKASQEHPQGFPGPVVAQTLRGTEAQWGQGQAGWMVSPMLGANTRQLKPRMDEITPTSEGFMGRMEVALLLLPPCSCPKGGLG